MDRIGSSIGRNRIGSSISMDRIGSSIGRNRIGSSISRNRIRSSIGRNRIGSSISRERFYVFTMNIVVNMRETVKEFGCIFIKGRVSRIDRVISILRVPNLVRRHDYMGNGSIFFFGVW